MTKKKTTKKSPASLAEAARKHNKKAAPPKKRRPRKPGTQGTKFDETRQQQYLSAVMEHGEKDLARHEVGVTYSTVKNHRKNNSEFKEAEEEATRVYRAKLSAEIHRRGYDGVQEPIYWNGMVVGWITKYSDRLLELHAKRHIPEYRDKVTVNQEHSGAVGLLADLSELPADIRTDLKKILKKLAKHEGE